MRPDYPVHIPPSTPRETQIVALIELICAATIIAVFAFFVYSFIRAQPAFADSTVSWKSIANSGSQELPFRNFEGNSDCEKPLKLAVSILEKLSYETYDELKNIRYLQCQGNASFFKAGAWGDTLVNIGRSDYLASPDRLATVLAHEGYHVNLHKNDEPVSEGYFVSADEELFCLNVQIKAAERVGAHPDDIAWYRTEAAKTHWWTWDKRRF